MSLTISPSDINDHTYSMYKKNDDSRLVQNDDNRKPEESSLSGKSLRRLVCIILITSFVFILIVIILALIPLFLTSSNNQQTTTQSSTTTSTTQMTTTSTTTSTSTTLTSTSTTTTVTATTTTTPPTTTTTTPTTTLMTSTASTTKPLTSTTTQTTIITTTIVPTTTVAITTMMTTTQCVTMPTVTQFTPSDYNTNNCSTAPVYEPGFLTLPGEYYFGYPIVQNIYCDDTKFTLQCPANQLINIYSAYLGIQPSTMYSYCATSSATVQVQCFFKNTYVKMRQLCQSKQTCTINLNTGNFGDPCPGAFNSQMLLQYQCVDADALNKLSSCQLNQSVSTVCPNVTGLANVYQNFSCDPSSGSSAATVGASCPVGTTINITCAYYGIDLNYQCDTGYYVGAPEKCNTVDSFTFIATTCNEKRSCQFTAPVKFSTSYPNNFREQCGPFKYTLFIQWQCLSSTTTTTRTSTAQTTTKSQTTNSNLPFCEMTTVSPLANCQPTTTYNQYVPRTLTDASNVYFGYPIYQQLICESAKLILTCPTDAVIHIYAAYFGTQSATALPDCVTAGNFQEIPDKCFLKDTFTIVSKSCEGKNACQVRATTTALGGADLCPGISKQMLVQYQCLRADILSSTVSKCPLAADTQRIICPVANTPVNESVWCDGSSMSIACPRPDQTITIVCAYYGIDSALGACNVDKLTYKPVCYYTSSGDKVKNECNGKNSCQIRDFPTYFANDPCVDLDKQLLIQWTCS